MSGASVDEELPDGWQVGKASDGRVFYINHQMQKTQWEHPVTGKMLAGPNESSQEESSVLYVDEQNSRLTSGDPRQAAAAAVRNAPAKDFGFSYSHQANALQILYGTDLSGKTAIVTGANSGVGFEIARSLAKHGCQVTLACRNLTKGEAACSKIRREIDNANVTCRQLDLCSLRQVKQFAEQYRQESIPLHYLILNAGVLHTVFRLTQDGYEEMFQVNYMAQAYLTILLLPAMLTTKSDQPPRVIAVSCESHRVESPGISALNGIAADRLSPRSAQYFDHLLSYGQSKLCLLMFIAEFRRNYPQIFSVACHPGNAFNSNLTRHSYLYRLLLLFTLPFAKSLQQAAATPIYCTVMRNVLNEQIIYYNNCDEGFPSSFAYNVKLTEELWIQTQTMIESAFKKQPLVV